jgi:hypothetical protein
VPASALSPTISVTPISPIAPGTSSQTSDRLGALLWTLLIVSLGDGEPAGIQTIDSVYQPPLDHASEVFAIARRAQAGELTPPEASAALAAALVAPPRFGTVAGGSATLGDWAPWAGVLGVMIDAVHAALTFIVSIGICR